ncbi:uncharacterized protein LY89DRAFT_716279 [Mollisia scopiformis]|uniref:Uncharacterized protein n=1 Tax=Mollisia scopiformis TaxID=149040 RepID=A0A194XI03_MOLSC|nr:uncharacterized protein LY89DRAFT_716279 [Mollisia scopiformis]KUJ19766.1 hypothetical protein LY89DRAFT_716279 [Mollisia scopiformis]
MQVRGTARPAPAQPTLTSSSPLITNLTQFLSSNLIPESTILDMSSIVHKIKEKYVLTRRGAYVTRRPDAATRTTALPPPPKKSKVADKESVVNERKQVETKYESDDEDSLLDEKRLEADQEASSSKKGKKVVRRDFGNWDEKEAVVSRRYRTRRQVVKTEMYVEEEKVEVSRVQTKGWWTRTMTACMPSEA